MLYSPFDSIDKKDITLILTLTSLNGEIASCTGGDELPDHKRKLLHKAQLETLTFLSPGLWWLCLSL